MLQNLKRVISNNLFMLGYAYRFTPGYLFHVCLFAIYSSVEVFFEFTYCTRYMIDLIQYHGSFTDALRYMIIIAVVIILKIIWAVQLTHNITPKAKEKLYKSIRTELFEKAVSLDLSCYDDPGYYNEFVWSISEANKRMDETVQNFSGLCGSVVSILVTGIFFVALDKIGLLFVAAGLITMLVLNGIVGKLKFEMEVELKPLQRKRSYISRVFYMSNYSKELRLHALVVDKLKKDFDTANKQILNTIDKHTGKQMWFSFLSSFVANNIILNCLYILYLLFIGLVKGLLSYGTILSLFNASTRLQNSLRSLATLLPKFQQNSLYIDKIRTFLSYETNIKEAEKAQDVPKSSTEIIFRDVSFSYNTSGDEVLKNISFSIKAGEKIAFVGYNGAGKTTLTKLLMRLYDPTGGEILLDGKNIKEYPIQSYRDSYGSAFQDYQLYAASVGENVVMNKVLPGDRERILKSLEDSGFSERLLVMEHGMDTELTREFNDNGTNLSGGEAQKLAIARVFAKDCYTIILDEPSSALDPISEYHLNEAMLKAAGGKTIIFISHRLSTTKMADRIYMLEKGRIIEEGTHDELISLNGKYAQMFNLQAERYRVQVDTIQLGNPA